MLLYELLTGSKPFDSAKLARAAEHELRRIIREDQPPRPSTRLSSLGAAGATIAAARRKQLDALEKELRSELEWIPMMAMRKERDRRYASPLEMAEDVKNYSNTAPSRPAPKASPTDGARPCGATAGRTPQPWWRRCWSSGASGRTSTPYARAAAWPARSSTRPRPPWRRSGGKGRRQQQRDEADRQRKLAERRQQEANAVVQFTNHSLLAGATPERMPDKALRDNVVKP